MSPSQTAVACWPLTVFAGLLLFVFKISPSSGVLEIPWAFSMGWFPYLCSPLCENYHRVVKMLDRVLDNADLDPGVAQEWR